MRTLYFLLLIAIILIVNPLVVRGEQWEDLNKRTTEYYKQQDFIKGAGAAKAALRLAREQGREHPENLIVSLNNLAMMKTHLGEFAEAERLNKEALGIVQKNFGMTDSRAVVAWNNLGLIYYFVKKYDDAEHCFREALYIAERHFGKEDTRLLPQLKRLGKFYKRVGWKKKATVVAERVARLEQKETVKEKTVQD